MTEEHTTAETKQYPDFDQIMRGFLLEENPADPEVYILRYVKFMLGIPLDEKIPSHFEPDPKLLEQLEEQRMKLSTDLDYVSCYQDHECAEREREDREKYEEKRAAHNHKVQLQRTCTDQLRRILSHWTVANQNLTNIRPAMLDSIDQYQSDLPPQWEEMQMTQPEKWRLVRMNELAEELQLVIQQEYELREDAAARNEWIALLREEFDLDAAQKADPIFDEGIPYPRPEEEPKEEKAEETEQEAPKEEEETVELAPNPAAQDEQK